MILAVMRAASSRKKGLKHFQPAVSMLFFADVGCRLMRSCVVSNVYCSKMKFNKSSLKLHYMTTSSR